MRACVCFPFQVSSDLIMSGTHQEQYFISKARHTTRHNSAIGILQGIKLGITRQSVFLLGIKLGNRHCTRHCARSSRKIVYDCTTKYDFLYQMLDFLLKTKNQSTCKTTMVPNANNSNENRIKLVMTMISPWLMQ